MNTRSNCFVSLSLSVALAVVFLGVFFVGLTGCASASAATPRAAPAGDSASDTGTVVYLVRHAETAPDAGRDPALMAPGVFFRISIASSMHRGMLILHWRKQL